jgi:hypothetical protein
MNPVNYQSGLAVTTTFKQRSLRDYLLGSSERKYMQIGDSCIQRLLPLGPVWHGNGNESSIEVGEAQMYTGKISDALLFKRKYLLTPQSEFIAEGMTHSDYTITWKGLDPTGYGKGKQIVDSNLGLNIAADWTVAESLSDSIWIGGDTIVEPNYAHWMFEHLLKFEALRISGISLDKQIIVSSRLPKSFLYWAELLVGKKLNYKQIDLTKPVRLRDVFTASCPAFRRKTDSLPCIWIEGFKALRHRLTSVAKTYSMLHEKKKSNILFLTRSEASWRKAVNESELFSIIEQRIGCACLSISKYSPLEQIEFAANAAVIIMFGGADGFISNFAHPSCKVIEVLAPNHVAMYTSKIFCAVHGISYTRIHGEEFIGDLKGPHPLDRDYIVDVDKFTECIRNVLA